MIFAGVATATAVVVIGKLVDVVLAATVMLDGTAAEALLDDRVTTIPPVGAGPFRVTVPVDDEPPRTDGGTTAMAVTKNGLIVRVAF